MPALHIPTRPRLTALLILAVDLLALAAAMGGALALRSALPHGGTIHWWAWERLAPALLLFPLAYGAFGLYPTAHPRPGVSPSPPEELRRLTYATSLVFLVLTATLFLARGLAYSRGALAIGWASTLVTVPLARALLRECFAAAPWWGAPVVILGAGDTARHVIANLRLHPGLGLKPVAVLDGDASHGEGPQQVDGVPVCGSIAEAPELAARYSLSYAILALPAMSRERLLATVERCQGVFPHLLLIPDLYGLASLWVQAQDLGGLLGLELREQLLLPGPRVLKRALDLVLAVLVLVLLGWAMLAIAALVKLTSPGPVLFRQTRLGLDGRTFTVWKFRSMKVGAEQSLKALLATDPQLAAEYATYRKLAHDPRLTPIGRFLRGFGLDELPQLWNIWRGEMSVVGPRAYLPEEREAMGPDAATILRTRPGVTGLWQVSGRNLLPFQTRVALDVYYVRNWSLWVDLYLLARTLWVVLSRKGAY